MANQVSKRTIVCPYCFNVFGNDEVLYQCESVERGSDGDYRCERESTPEYDNYWHSEELPHRHIMAQRPQRGLFGFGKIKLDAVRCDRCGYNSRRFVCPHCHNWLPTPMIEAGAEIISVIGGPSSGKTNYIVALMHELKRVGYKINLSIAPQEVYREGHKNESTSAMFRDKERMLFREKTCLAKTPVDEGKNPIPWIFSLTNNKTQRTIYLVFYDSAGESFEDQETITQYANYFNYSSAVIVLLDTISIEPVKEVMSQRHPDALNYESKVEFNNTVTTILNRIESQGDGQFNLGRKPFAFAFSKFDMVLKNKDAWSHEVSFDAFAQNSDFLASGVVDIDQINMASETIADLMHQWGEGGVVERVRGKWRDAKGNASDDNFKFFGVSAFGSIPDENLMLQQVAPYRVMDPLVWVLYRLGGFDMPIK